MNSRTARLLCPLVFMGMVGCSDAEMRKFVWTLRMIVFGAGGICGAITGLVVSLMHNKSNPQRMRSIPLSIVTGCIIGGSVFVMMWLIFWHGIVPLL